MPLLLECSFQTLMVMRIVRIRNLRPCPTIVNRSRACVMENGRRFIWRDGITRRRQLLSAGMKSCDEMTASSSSVATGLAK